MRTLLLLLSILSVVSVACDDARNDDPGSSVERTPPSPSRARPSDSADAGEESALRVGGTVFTDEGVPIDGRPIALVDARGKYFEVLSDEGGAFWFLDVKPPYDLAIAPSPSGAGAAPTVFMGLSELEPHIELYERTGTSTLPAAQTIRVAVRVTGPGTVSVVTASPSGGGSSASSVGANDGDVVTFQIEHAWRKPALAANETIDLHVLASNAERSSFTYAHRSAIGAAPGDLVDLGLVEPQQIDATDAVDLRASAAGAPASWTTILATWIDLPGGGEMSFTYGEGASATMRLPLVHGATLRATAWMQRPPADDPPYAYEAAQAWSGTRPIAAGPIDLVLSAPPVPVRPLAGGTMSRRGIGIGWNNPAMPPHLTEATVTNVAHGSLRYRVFTADDEIPNAKLERLGLRPLEPGAHVLGLTTTPNRTVDEVVATDASRRRARNDQVIAGSASYRRFAFMVTP